MLLTGLAVLVGLEAEARIARTLVDARLVGVSGATPEGAGRAIERLAGAGATALLSFGLAGGLDPALPAGAVLLPTHVSVEGRLLPAAEPLRRLLLDRLGGIAIHEAPLLHSDVLVGDPLRKRQLHRDTGCGALDMESGHAALQAARRGLAFASLRAVCDRGDSALPPAACIPLRADGRIRTGAIAASILSRPGQLAGLVRLARDAAAARRALTGCAAVLTMIA